MRAFWAILRRHARSGSANFTKEKKVKNHSNPIRPNWAVVAGLLAVFAVTAADQPLARAEEPKKVLDVYSDANAASNHFIPSGFMGDYTAISLKVAQKLNPHSGATCMRFTYDPTTVTVGGAHWGGVQWQNPEGNWGTQNGGIDLTGAKRLTFWARGKNGGEKIDKFQVGGISTGEFPDSDQESIGPVVLTKEWKQYTIDLADTDLSYIAGGFCWATSAQSVPNGVTFYLDDIRYEY